MNIYDSIAANYNRYREPHHLIVNSITDTINNESLNSGRIIELGCGTGCYAEKIAETFNKHIYCVDISDSMLALASERCHLIIDMNDCNKTLCYQDDYFRFCYSVNFIQYINDLSNFFSEVYRILEYGGVTYTATHSEQDLHRQTLGYYFPDSIDLELSNSHTIDAIVGALSRNKFSRIVVEEVSAKSPVTPSRLEAFRTKTYFCLHKISDSSYRKGMRRMERDFNEGITHGMLSYTIIKGLKNE